MIRPNQATIPDISKQRARIKTRRVGEIDELPEDQLERLVLTLEEEMNVAAGDLRFEYAARLRDEIRELKRDLKDMK